MLNAVSITVSNYSNFVFPKIFTHTYIYRYLYVGR